jgi:hypothetical protein
LKRKSLKKFWPIISSDELDSITNLPICVESKISTCRNSTLFRITNESIT